MGNIKWLKRDTENVKKLVRSYNAKIDRLKKKGYDVELLPEKVTYTKIKKQVETRQDLNTEVELMKAFTRKYSETVAKKSSRGAVLPRYMEKQIDIKLKVINRERKKQKEKYEKMPQMDRNKKLGSQIQNFGRTNLSHLNPREFNFKDKSRKELLLFNESISKYNQKTTDKMKLYRESYYKRLQQIMTAEQYNKIVEVLDQLSDEKITEKYYTSLNMDLDFLYEPQENEAIFNVVFDTWREIAQQDKQLE